MIRLPRTLGSAIKLLLACTLLAACTPYADMCDKKMACEGGNDADYDACVIDFNKDDDLSSLYGCDSLWDRYLECRGFQDECDNNRWVDHGDCNDERDGFRKCAGTADIL